MARTVTLPRERPIEPPQERYQHGDVITREKHSNEPGVYFKRVQTCDRLDHYLHLGTITRRQYDAGQQLYASWYNAGASPVIIGHYGVRLSGGNRPGEWITRAAEFLEACRKLGTLANIVVSVACHGHSAREWERARGRRNGSGLSQLRDGLDILGNHYGLPV